MATLMLQHMHNRQDCGKEYNIREMGEMVNTTIRKILDLYKDGKIDANEAETMLSSLGVENKTHDSSPVPWEDDGNCVLLPTLEGNF